MCVKMQEDEIHSRSLSIYSRQTSDLVRRGLESGVSAGQVSLCVTMCVMKQCRTSWNNVEWSKGKWTTGPGVCGLHRFRVWTSDWNSTVRTIRYVTHCARTFFWVKKRFLIIKSIEEIVGIAGKLKARNPAKLDMSEEKQLGNTEKEDSP